MHVHFLPKHIPLTIGGSYVGLEFGQMYRRFGSRVTIIEQHERLIGHEDPDISDTIRKILEKEGIEIPSTSNALLCSAEQYERSR